MTEQHMGQPMTEQFDREGVAPPPRLLWWLILGMMVLFIVASVGAVFVFREVLVPGQQQRVIDQLPFMRAFMPPTPQGGVLPTAIPGGGGGDISPDDLLAAPLLDATATPTEEPTEAPVIEVVPSMTPTIRPSSTPPPTATQTATEVSAAIPTDTSTAFDEPVRPSRPASYRNFGFQHVKQTWNNCGPANITMALSYFGWQQDQSFAATILKPDREDKNVSPTEMVAFVNEETQVRAITRIGGNLDMLRELIAAGFPVVIETGYMPEGYDWIGHYQTIVGYDDALRVFYLYDSFLGSGENGEGITESYESLDTNWKHFNRTFIVVYEPSREGAVAQILGELADPTTAAEIALRVATEEARANPNDGFAWFNMGTAFTRLGQYEEAARRYDQALRTGLPFRMTWYQFGPFEAYYNVDRFDDVLALVNANLNNGAEYVEETYYWQGRVFAARGERAAAEGAFRRALQHNPRYTEAREALDALIS